MRFARPDADAEKARGFFVAPAFGEQTHDLALPGGQLLLGLAVFPAPVRGKEFREKNLGNLGREEWLVLRHRPPRSCA